MAAPSHDVSLPSVWYRCAEADLEHAVLIPDLSRWGQATALHNISSLLGSRYSSCKRRGDIIVFYWSWQQNLRAAFKLLWILSCWTCLGVNRDIPLYPAVRWNRVTPYPMKLGYPSLSETLGPPYSLGWNKGTPYPRCLYSHSTQYSSNIVNSVRESSFIKEALHLYTVSGSSITWCEPAICVIQVCRSWPWTCCAHSWPLQVRAGHSIT